jgi:hypothetical protein
MAHSSRTSEYGVLLAITDHHEVEARGFDWLMATLGFGFAGGSV